MAEPTAPRRLAWRQGIVVELISETARTKSVALDVSAWPGHHPGQHVDIRLTRPDGHQAERSYSIASAPEDGYLVLTVEKRPDGEVSPYLFDKLAVGDELWFRGPIGAYFMWDPSNRSPVLLLAAGSGIVPFRSMLRHWTAIRSDVPLRLLYFARSQQDIIYADELARLAAYDEVDIRLALTHEWPDGWHGHRGRIDRQLLDETCWPPAQRPLIYICGHTAFVEDVAALLVDSGHHPTLIKTERFGPTDE